MSTKDLVNAIIIGDALEINAAFNSTLAEKISDRLEERRQMVAQSMFVKEEKDKEDDKEDDDDDEEDEDDDKEDDDEEDNQLDELSKKTLSSYTKAAAGSVAVNAHKAGSGDNKAFGKVAKRLGGINKATSKLAKEDVAILHVSNIESALYAIEDGRGVLDSQIDEEVSTDSKVLYESVNMKSPVGTNIWTFSTIHPNNYNGKLHKEQTVQVHGKFADAAKKASAYFKESGHRGQIHILA